jgi:hypothetical protein
MWVRAHLEAVARSSPLSPIQNNSDLAQGPLPIRPSKVRRDEAPGGVHGTETRANQVRICLRDRSCDGGDHPSDHDVGGPRLGCADSAHGRGLQASTFEFVLKGRHPYGHCDQQTLDEAVALDRAGDREALRHHLRSYGCRLIYPERSAMIRNLSCLISCSHRPPEGSLPVLVGRTRRDEPGRQGTLQHADLNRVEKRWVQLRHYSSICVIASSYSTKCDGGGGLSGSRSWQLIS